jgi:hypothetical protein
MSEIYESFLQFRPSFLSKTDRDSMGNYESVSQLTKSGYDHKQLHMSQIYRETEQNEMINGFAKVSNCLLNLLCSTVSLLDLYKFDRPRSNWLL